MCRGTFYPEETIDATSSPVVSDLLAGILGDMILRYFASILVCIKSGYSTQGGEKMIAKKLMTRTFLIGSILPSCSLQRSR